MTGETHEDTVLRAVLAAYQLQARVLYHPSWCGDWKESEDAAAPGAAWFHLVDTGICLLGTDVLAEPLRLEAGDLVVLSRGSAHLLQGAAGASPEAHTTLLCGEFAFASEANPILRSLPDLIVVRAREGGDGFRRVAELLLQEARIGGFGSAAVMDKLADALFVMTLRHHLASSHERRGLLAALADPRLARALQAMHADPGRDWTVAALAAEAHLSRTVFAQRFAEALGDGPYLYLTRLRMTEALRLLRDPRLSVAAVAERLGYQTEAAFRRGFKRIHGYGPGAVRRKEEPSPAR